MALNFDFYNEIPGDTTPTSLNASLSGNGVIVHTLGTNVAGVAFNAVNLTGSLTNINANGTRLRIDTAFNGTPMAVVYHDRSSTVFSVVTASGAGYNNQSLGTTSFDVTTPETRRLRNQGSI